MSSLTEVAKSQPHAVYCTFNLYMAYHPNGTYVLRVLDVEPNLLQPQEHQIRIQLFTMMISSQSAPNDLPRELIALSVS